MLRALVVIAALIAVPLGVAASVRSVTTAGPVVAIALDSRRVAYAEGLSTRDCDRVWVWNLQTRRVTKLGRSTPCVQTSTGVGIASLTLAGGRALWLHYAGGNIREWRLFTATVSAPRPRLLRFVALDVDAPAPIVVGDGNTSRFGDLLPYAVGRDVVVLRPDGSRRFTWRAPARVTAVSALFGEIAVAGEDGLVTVLSAAGTVVGSAQFSGSVSAVKLSGDGVLAQVRSRLELFRAGETRTFALPRNARLEDAQGERAYFVAGGQIRQLLLTTGEQKTIAAGSHIGVALATVAVSSGRRVTARPLP